MRFPGLARGFIVIGSFAALLILSACTGGSDTPTPTVTTPPVTSAPSTCQLSAKLVPSCGVLWGVATSPNTIPVISGLESKLGRQFALSYQYDDLTEQLPTQVERDLIAQGRVLHISVAARIYGDEHEITYSDIAAGKYDAYLRAQGQGIASLKVPVFITFEQEANQKRKLGTRGDAVAFIAAWRHMHDIYTSQGATNAVWVWVMTGDPANFARAGSIWPGNDYVDWISWNVYNQSGCHGGTVDPSLYASFESKLSPFFGWVHAQGPRLGIDPTKPMMVSEAGSVTYSGNAAKSAAWYASIPSVLARYPQIKAFALWDSKTSNACDYRFQNDATMLAAVAKAGLESPVNPGRMALPASAGN